MSLPVPSAAGRPERWTTQAGAADVALLVIPVGAATARVGLTIEADEASR